MRWVLSAAAFLATATAFAQEDYSNYKVGNKWVFKSADGSEITYSISGTEKKNGKECLVLEIKTAIRTTKEWIAVTAEAELLCAKGRDHFDPPYARLKYPPKIGDKWESKTTVKSEVEEDAELTASYEIIGTEDVDVPAGHYNCLKVLYTIKKGAGEVSGIQWRADGVGLVRYELNPGGKFELTKFEGAGAAPADRSGEYFPLKDGQKWVYQHGETESVCASKFVAAHKDGEEFQLTFSIGDAKETWNYRTKKDGVQIVKEGDQAVEQYLLKYPLKEGNKWDCKFAGVDYSVEAVKQEEVQVPAGKFKCWLIRMTSKDGKTIAEMWLAPSVGPVKSKNAGDKGTIELQLKKYEAPK